LAGCETTEKGRTLFHGIIWLGVAMIFSQDGNTRLDLNFYIRNERFARFNGLRFYALVSTMNKFLGPDI
jgi:hypothetical protein